MRLVAGSLLALAAFLAPRIAAADCAAPCWTSLCSEVEGDRGVVVGEVSSVGRDGVALVVVDEAHGGAVESYPAGSELQIQPYDRTAQPGDTVLVVVGTESSSSYHPALFVEGESVVCDYGGPVSKEAAIRVALAEDCYDEAEAEGFEFPFCDDLHESVVCGSADGTVSILGIGLLLAGLACLRWSAA